MRVIDADKLNAFNPRGSAVCVGAFDGLHIGHQYLLRHLCAEAASADLESVVVTFEPLPGQFFSPPDTPPMRLTTRVEKTALLAKACCCDSVLFLDFNQSLASLTAREFCRIFLVEKLNTRLLIASATHSIGSDRANIEQIENIGRELGFAVQRIPPVNLGELRVCSTTIRRLLREGHVEEAAGLLGRMYSAEGPVVTGRAVGRTLGYPTANIDVPHEKLLPHPAVYAATATLLRSPGKRPFSWPAAVSVGAAPTFGVTEETVEAFLITEEELHLVGSTLRIEFMRRLRWIQHFSDVNELKNAIAADVRETLRLREGLQKRTAHPRP